MAWIGLAGAKNPICGPPAPFASLPPEGPPSLGVVSAGLPSPPGAFTHSSQVITGPSQFAGVGASGDGPGHKEGATSPMIF
jgi:hypothetical protein